MGYEKLREEFGWLGWACLILFVLLVAECCSRVDVNTKMEDKLSKMKYELKLKNEDFQAELKSQLNAQRIIINSIAVDVQKAALRTEIMPAAFIGRKTK